MNMFEEIDNLKNDLPKVKTVTKEFSSIKMNIFQKISILIFCICISLGVLFGNLFPVCGSSSDFYSDYCFTTEFNISLMLFIWFISFIVCLFLYEAGAIISLLSSINDKMGKK